MITRNGVVPGLRPRKKRKLGCVPVSYTHLDVYKRQINEGMPMKKYASFEKYLEDNYYNDIHRAITGFIYKRGQKGLFFLLFGIFF